MKYYLWADSIPLSHFLAAICAINHSFYYKNVEIFQVKSAFSRLCLFECLLLPLSCTSRLHNFHLWDVLTHRGKRTECASKSKLYEKNLKMNHCNILSILMQQSGRCKKTKRGPASYLFPEYIPLYLESNLQGAKYNKNNYNIFFLRPLLCLQDACRLYLLSDCTRTAWCV